MKTKFLIFDYIRRDPFNLHVAIFMIGLSAVFLCADSAGAVSYLGDNNYLTLVKDPDGNIIEFVGPKK